jgi:hypothetical protein
MGNYCNKCIYTIPIIFKTRFVDKNLLGLYTANIGCNGNLFGYYIEKMNMLATEVLLSLPRITAMEYGDLDLSLIPTVNNVNNRLLYIKKKQHTYLFSFVVLVGRYFVNLFDHLVPVPVVRKSLINKSLYI